MRRSVVLLVLAACGRVDFEPLGGAGGPLPCGAGASAPDPLSITGDTFQFTSFQNQRAAVAGASVVFVGTTQAVAVTSDAGGLYTAQIPTGGNALDLVAVHYREAGFFDTTIYPDAPLDRDLAGPNPEALWTIADTPLWTPGAVDSIYSFYGATQQGLSMFSVEVLDCAGQPLEGVTIDASPAPPVLTTVVTSGSVDLTNHTTGLPFANVIGLNAQPGTVHISAHAPGLTFVDRDIPLPSGGTEHTLILMRPLL